MFYQVGRNLDKTRVCPRLELGSAPSEGAMIPLHQQTIHIECVYWYTFGCKLQNLPKPGFEV